MNHDTDNLIDPQREAYRNGELSATEAAAFEKRLADDPQLRQDFEAESALLGMLAEDDIAARPETEDQAMTLSPEAFTEAVLERWDSERAARASRAAWLSPLRLTLTTLAAAAAVALAAYVGIQWLGDDAPTDAQPAPQFAEGQDLQTVEPVTVEDGGQAMATLVKETQATFVDRPRVLWRQLEEQVSAMSINELPALLPSPIPDPAKLLEEPVDAEPGNSAQMFSPDAPRATM